MKIWYEVNMCKHRMARFVCPLGLVVNSLVKDVVGESMDMDWWVDPQGDAHQPHGHLKHSFRTTNLQTKYNHRVKDSVTSAKNTLGSNKANQSNRVYGLIDSSKITENGEFRELLTFDFMDRVGRSLTKDKKM